LKLCDEVVLYDCDAEGQYNGFNEHIVKQLGINKNKLIYTGGVSEMAMRKQACLYNPKSILIENKIIHKENSKKTFYGTM
jgi:phosphoribosylformimino-5-aminoimidazole carboxamide ribonucleotide (ProFAR) isomerase